MMMICPYDKAIEYDDYKKEGTLAIDIRPSFQIIDFKFY